jgi:hypothetical protein
VLVVGIQASLRERVSPRSLEYDWGKCQYLGVVWGVRVEVSCSTFFWPAQRRLRAPPFIVARRRPTHTCVAKLLLWSLEACPSPGAAWLGERPLEEACPSHVVAWLAGWPGPLCRLWSAAWHMIHVTCPFWGREPRLGREHEQVSEPILDETFVES